MPFYLSDEQVIKFVGHLNEHSITFQLNQLTNRLVYSDLGFNSHLALLLDMLFAQNLTFYMPPAWTFSLERSDSRTADAELIFLVLTPQGATQVSGIAFKYTWKMLPFRENECCLLVRFKRFFFNRK